MSTWSPRRRTGAVLLVVAVLLVHGWLGDRVAANLIDLSDGGPTSLQRMDVAFVRELLPSLPPPPPPVARAAPLRRAAPRPVRIASQPELPELAPLELPASAPQVAEAASEPASAPEVVAAASAPAVPAPAASEPVAPGFEWPPSTRLDYTLIGNYQGEVRGQARVQWIRQGPRYQVHLDVAIGPPFAPMLSRRMTSDGELTERGLRPRRYEEQTDVLLGRTRRASMQFNDEHIVMGNGKQRPPWPGVQDTASQFVQMTWLFTTHPERLKVGTLVPVPLALPRRVDMWHYEVLSEETLSTPVGEFATFHVRPKRDSPRKGELVAEMWIAPTLQYLPVRIRIQQDSDTYADLLLDSRPKQTTEGGS